MEKLSKTVSSQCKTVESLRKDCAKITKHMDELPQEELLYEEKDKCANILEECVYITQILENIKKTLNDNINIIIVGSTSAGKSKIVNALLGKDIIVSSAGHSTRCFVKISMSSQNSIEFPSKQVFWPTTDEEIKKIITYYTYKLRDDHQTKDEEIKIGLEICNPIFKKNVYVYDSPGLGRDKEITAFVTEKCKRMDIMIFVMNYNLSLDNKKTLEHLAKYTSRIPTFYLINKWDETDNDTTPENMGSMKADIEEYINSTLNIGDETEEDLCGMNSRRYFYVSGMEMVKPKSMEPRNYAQRLRRSDFIKFQDNLESLINNDVKLKESRHYTNLKNTEEWLNKLKERCLNIKGKLKYFLVKHIKKYELIREGYTNLINELDNHKRNIDPQINVLKDSYSESNEDFLKKLIKLNEPFSKIYGDANKIMNSFIALVPDKKREIECGLMELESKKRTIVELNNQRGKEMNRAIIARGGAVVAGVVTGGAMAVGAAATVVALPLVAAGVLGYLAYGWFKGSDGKEQEIKSTVKDIKQDLQKQKEELHNAYSMMRVGIEKSNLDNICKDTESHMKAFLENLK